MSDLYQQAKKHFENKLPFVLYSKPNETVAVGIFQKDDSLHFTTDFTEIGFVFAPFEGKDFVVLPEKESEVYIENYALTPNKSTANSVAEANTSGKENFEELVQKGIDTIREGDFKKVVLSRKESVVLEQIDIFLLFQKLLSAYPAAFKYCFFHPKIGWWLGATPEQLLKVSNDRIKTVALAGTQVYHEGEITWENKEQEEQQFVTEFILDGLKSYVAEQTISEPYTFRAGNIVHIKTDIEARLQNQEDLGMIIKILHPTPAVCGLPKKEAKEFILKNEGYDREYYSGFLGELNKDFAKGQEQNSDLFVNLRCMKVENKTANLFIGCGITKDSIPEKEFLETVNKSLTMKNILG
ncbi:isochorismate synthase [Flavobacterium endophyticum]|uniref:isochorismate synthase n=1 Tax=Flavobacterium endophyticum TaxID=1540163 RepID=A0A495MHU2_9FLAO|nr:chorismate-binding protein [Flavobacterium endophyticum]RKS25020.1 isochorismate synthase [Flavobacterium endophyticum]